MVWKITRQVKSQSRYSQKEEPQEICGFKWAFQRKDSASDSIADSSDAFVVPSEAIGEHVYSVSGL